ncbi:MAG: hypothetical protein JSU06_16525 [Actinobacteria bacterium]|nr:hypothetical protein [Actinomycetota bacterium]
MNRDSLGGMETQRPIVFLDALIRLQAMLGHHVKVEFNDYGTFFGGGFEGKLEKVDTEPKGVGISAFVSGGAGFFLDPDNCQAYWVDIGTEAWLEFHRPIGPLVAIQAVDADDAGDGSDQ